MFSINLTDWLYRNGYDYIYEEWLRQNEYSEWDFVKEKYPQVWSDYIMANEENDTTFSADD